MSATEETATQDPSHSGQPLYGLPQGATAPGAVPNTPSKAPSPLPHPRRRKLPRKRRGRTYELRIAGQKMYVRTGEYEDGTLGEVFIDMNKEGSTMRSVMNGFAVAVSLGLQHGVPLEKYVRIFTGTRFDPSGIVEAEGLKSATSIFDLIFRVIGAEYGRNHEAAL